MGFENMMLSEGETKLVSLVVVILLIALLFLRWKGERDRPNDFS